MGGCIVPADANGNAQCLASRLTAPATTLRSQAVPIANPRAPFIAEGRAYNQHLYKQIGNAAAYQLNGYNPGLPVAGAYYRIQTSHSMNPSSTTSAPITCQFPDMTDQIGCLVNASPCSIGYAGRGAVVRNPAVDALKIDRQNPSQLCIQGSSTVPGFAYPLSRKLYLNTLVGFSAVTGNELQLAGCETDLAQPSAPQGATPAGLVTTNAATMMPTFGFVNVGAAGGNEPYCEDFDENMLCSPDAVSPAFPTNTNACATPPPSIGAFPGLNTVCGNGIQEAYEDCDCGTAQMAATAPASNVALCNGTVNGGPICSTTCRR
jgi:hypothetical protein